MKVELKKESNHLCEVLYYVYVDNWVKESFKNLSAAREYYDSIKTPTPEVEILETKEV